MKTSFCCCLLFLLLSASIKVTRGWPLPNTNCTPCVCTRQVITEIGNSPAKSALCEGLHLGAIPSHLPPDLQYLNLDHNDLTSDDLVDLRQYPGLQAFSVRNNSLSSLTKGLFKSLHRLQFIDLTGCKPLNVTSDAFKGARRLMVITGLRLTHTPVNLFHGLSTLRYLHLTMDDLIPPAGLFDGLSLAKLEVSFSETQNLTDSFFQETSRRLKEIVIHGEHLTSISENVFALLANLQKVKLFIKDMVTLPVGIFSGSGRSLKGIWIDGVHSIPGDLFRRLTELSKLTLHNLKQPPDANFTKSLQSLVFLDLSRCAIIHLHKSWFEVPRLMSLDLSHNDIQGVGLQLSSLDILQNLNLSDNKVSWIHEEAFQGRFKTKIESLDLSNNRLDSLAPGLFRDMSNLHTLRLNNNYITGLHQDLFVDLLLLTRLYLQHNKLRVLGSDNFPDKQLIDLVYLDVSFNSIIEISSGAFENLPSLEIINLSHNFLKVFPGFSNIEMLRQIYMQGNNLSCQCDHLSNFDQIRHLVEYLRIFINATCATPQYLAGQNITMVGMNGGCQEVVTYGKPEVTTTTEGITSLDITVESTGTSGHPHSSPSANTELEGSSPPKSVNYQKTSLSGQTVEGTTARGSIQPSEPSTPGLEAFTTTGHVGHSVSQGDGESTILPVPPIVVISFNKTNAGLDTNSDFNQTIIFGSELTNHSSGGKHPQNSINSNVTNPRTPRNELPTDVVIQSVDHQGYLTIVIAIVIGLLFLTVLLALMSVYKKMLCKFMSNHGKVYVLKTGNIHGIL